jgi:hypothetical protein
MFVDSGAASAPRFEGYRSGTLMAVRARLSTHHHRAVTWVSCATAGELGDDPHPGAQASPPPPNTAKNRIRTAHAITAIALIAVKPKDATPHAGRGSDTCALALLRFSSCARNSRNLCASAPARETPAALSRWRRGLGQWRMFDQA